MSSADCEASFGSSFLTTVSGGLRAANPVGLFDRDLRFETEIDTVDIRE